MNAYKMTRKELLADLRFVREWVNSHPRASMEKIAAMLRRCWAAQLALLALRADHYGYTYDMAKAEEGRS